MRIEWQVEIDDYARRVLAKHWPTVPKYGDIRSIDWGTVKPVTVLCGGFPCQDLSYAGKRAGLREGTRSGLWFEYLRAIRALRPQYILVENVPGLLDNHALGRVLGDLAESGYDAEWDCISAADIGGCHLRRRIWLCAYPNRIRLEEKLNNDEIRQQKNTVFRNMAMSNMLMRDEPTPPRTSFCGVRDGIPNRVDRLKGLGNAVVPQIVEALGRMILASNKERPFMQSNI